MTRRVVTLALVLVATAVLPSVAAARPTYVSLTFDDGTADQLQAASALAANGLHGTFYINSPTIGSSPKYMTWDQVGALAAAGHEIAGHTLTHPDLTTLPPDQQVSQICDDRANIVAHGLNPTSFAYPFAKSNPVVRQSVANCGYKTGRGVGNVTCPACPAAESVPPSDPFDLRTPPGITAATTLDQIETYVANTVAAGGGWVILTFHTDCDACQDPNAIAPKTFQAFATWLAGLPPANNVHVATIADVAGLPAPPPPPNLLKNADLEAIPSVTAPPTCWTRAGFAGATGGNHAGTWAHSADVHSPANAEQVTISTFVDGDEKLISNQDRAGSGDPCSPAGTAGHTYQASAWYKTSDGAGARMIAYYRDAAGAWIFWREQVVPASTTWTQATWNTPILPEGATALSVAFSLRSSGTANVDDLALGDITDAVPALTSTVAAAPVKPAGRPVLKGFTVRLVRARRGAAPVLKLRVTVPPAATKLRVAVRNARRTAIVSRDVSVRAGALQRLSLKLRPSERRRLKPGLYKVTVVARTPQGSSSNTQSRNLRVHARRR